MKDDKRRKYIASLFEQYAATVRTKLKAIGFEGATLEDLTHDVFVVALVRAKDIPGDPQAWLLATARRKAANYRRRHYHSAEVSDDDAAMTAGAEPELLDLLCSELEARSDADRDLLIRYYIQGEKVADLALYLGLKRDSVYTRLRAVKLRFHRGVWDDELEEHDDDGSSP